MPYLLKFGPKICDGFNETRIVIRRNDKYYQCAKLVYAPSDRFTHIYRLALKKDGTYDFFIDSKIVE